MFPIYICIWKLFASFALIIFASSAEQNFTTIISLCVIVFVQWHLVIVVKYQVKQVLVINSPYF